MKFFHHVVAIVAFALLIACGQPAKPSTPPTVACQQDPRVQSYAANLTRSGAQGLTFVLSQANPSPPASGLNTWKMQVLDAQGHTMAGATIVSVKPYMPDHGHSPSVTPQVVADENGFSVSNIDFFMPGVWQVTVEAQAGQLSDSAVFTLCIAG